MEDWSKYAVNEEPPQKPGWFQPGSKSEAIARGYASGIPFTNKIGAAVNAGLSGMGIGQIERNPGEGYFDQYARLRDEGDMANKNAAKEHPLLYYGSGIGSGAALGAGGVVRNAVLGGLYGASETGNTNADVVKNTATGGAIGGVIGGSGKLVGMAIDKYGMDNARDIIQGAIKNDNIETLHNIYPWIRNNPNYLKKLGLDPKYLEPDEVIKLTRDELIKQAQKDIKMMTGPRYQEYAFPRKGQEPRYNARENVQRRFQKYGSNYRGDAVGLSDNLGDIVKPIGRDLLSGAVGSGIGYGGAKAVNAATGENTVSPELFAGLGGLTTLNSAIRNTLPTVSKAAATAFWSSPSRTLPGTRASVRGVAEYAGSPIIRGATNLANEMRPTKKEDWSKYAVEE